MLVDKRLYVANECGHPIGIVIKVIKGAADADLYFDAVFMCLADKIGFEKAIGATGNIERAVGIKAEAEVNNVRQFGVRDLLRAVGRCLSPTRIAVIANEPLGRLWDRRS